MGKASRKKKERRAAADRDPNDVYLHRLRAGRCLHCGGQRGQAALWCGACSLRVWREKAPLRRMPGGPDHPTYAPTWPTTVQMIAVLDDIQFGPEYD